MAENLNLKTVETVDTRPFRKLVMTIGELPTSFIESMTYYELLAWFTNYLETVIIPTVNNNGEAVEELQNLGIESNYVEHGKNMFPVDANGVPFSAMLFAVTGDPIVDLTENLAAEEKARIVYERLMDLTNDPDVLAPLSFLREREVIHYQRFGELLNKYNKMKNERLI